MCADNSAVASHAYSARSMLLTLLIWIYVSILTYLAGHAVLHFGRWNVGSLPPVSTPVICLLGAAGLTTLSGWLWLLVPIGPLTHLVLAAGLAGYAIWLRPRPSISVLRGKHPVWLWLTVGILFAVVWIRSVQLPRLVDTGGYHAPMIEWIHQYAIVPGLANLNYRFGFNNSWFLLNALFRFQLTTNVVWHGLNGWLMAMVGWFSVTEWQRYHLERKRPFSGWLGSWLALGLLVIFHWTLSSPSPDLPTHVYVALCFWVWLRRSESIADRHTDGWTWLLLLLSLSALTTKLSAVTILILPVLALLPALLRGQWRMVGAAVLTVMLWTGYWFAGNIILSGYVAYPSLSPLVDWFTVDWKVPRSIIQTGLYNLQQGTRGDLGSTLSVGWIPYWFRTRPLLEQGLAVALLGAPIMLLVRQFRSAPSIPGYGPALVTACIGVIFWFLVAPEIRFGAGNVLLLLGLSYGPALWWAKRWPVRLSPISWAITSLTGVVLLVAALRREPVGWLMPTGYPNEALQSYRIDGHSVWYPTGDQRVINGIRGYWGECYDAPLPCSPYPIPNLKWRGQTLTDGFSTQAETAP